ncbi:hypothetical protein ACFW6Q_09815 [Streptomyces sp. NPDC058737]|uniref:hypothetical protein n=1 Tax=Streptomyces sp. NPDC058737 TaxID=3346617 RepID=UPI0036A46454
MAYAASRAPIAARPPVHSTNRAAASVLGFVETLGEAPVPKLGGHVEHGLLGRRAEVGIHVRDVSEDERGSGGEVLVNDGFDSGQRPGVVIGRDGDASAAGADDQRSLFGMAWTVSVSTTALRRRGRDDAAPSRGVLDDVPAALAGEDVRHPRE